MNLKKIYLATGIFLVADGILSVYFSHSCLQNCVNNSQFGDYVRYTRAILGGVLIYFNYK